MARGWTLEKRKRVYWYPSGQADYNSEYVLQFLIGVKFLWFRYRTWIDVHSVDAHAYKSHKEGIGALLKEFKNRKNK